ncbi:MAG: hypothetical protein JSW00_02920 [Thermoplasmata archaeon]|nr:MAG: hypothetical protein JSW00_02920 [Thermoplasmata archaeon]
MSSDNNESPELESQEDSDNENMGSKEDEESSTEDEGKGASEENGFFNKIMAPIDRRYPKIGKLLRDIRIQAFLLFLILLIFYINLVVWDFYFTSDTVEYGLMLKNYFEGNEVSNRDIFRPAHPLTTPLAIVFTYPMLPLIGKDYLLSFAILNSILGSLTIAVFFLICNKFVGNRKYSLICSLGLAFSFAFWENCEMAEDKHLGFLMMTLYLLFLFAYVGEMKSIKWFEALKPWQKGLVTGIFMGLTLAAHIFFALLFIASLFIIWRYEGLKFLKSIKFIFYLLGTIIICVIVFGSVAYILKVESLEEFIGLFTYVHRPDSEYFSLSDPENFSVIIQIREMAGGVFTTLLMFISSDPIYYGTTLFLGAIVFLIMAFILISARGNKIVRSVYIMMVPFFLQGFFYGGGDRNAWVYLLTPVWLSICIGLSLINTEEIKLLFLKQNIPKKMKRYIIPMTGVIVVILLVNNGIVFYDAHVNKDLRIDYIHDTTKNIDVKNSIMLTDEPMKFFYGYYSDIETIKIIDVIRDPNVSDYINSSFENGISIYILEFWFRDSYVKVGTPKYAQTHDTRLQSHHENIARFNAMYNYRTVYYDEFSDIYQITELNQTR